MLWNKTAKRIEKKNKKKPISFTNIFFKCLKLLIYIALIKKSVLSIDLKILLSAANRSIFAYSIRQWNMMHCVGLTLWNAISLFCCHDRIDRPKIISITLFNSDRKFVIAWHYNSAEIDLYFAKRDVYLCRLFDLTSSIEFGKCQSTLW